MLRILFLAVAVFVGGWVAWPAFSAYQIYSGMKSADVSVLRDKINWDSMRASLRPVVASEVEKSIGKMGGKGLAGAMMPQLKRQFMPQIIDMAMKTVVTPKGLSQVMAHGGDVSSAVKKIVSKQVGKLGGLGALTGGGSGNSGGGGLLGGLLGGDSQKGIGGMLGGLLGNKKVRELAGDKIGGVMGGMGKSDPAPEMEEDKPAKPSYGLGNIKRFAYTGLGAMELGVAKDPATEGSDVVAIMEFQNFDWKLTGLVPRVR
ncbi:MAG: DUF2939 domain-containing protein [Hyphomicrobiaceae bacterium]|nr:DUF2939 domain-containing protein [Hyphomicrobiaceae bacterium]